MIYDNSNVVSTHTDCTTCNPTCYKLVDCLGLTPTLSTTSLTFEVYVGKTIKWVDNTGDQFCSTVDKYSCNDEAIPLANIVEILDCYDTCYECTFVPTVEVPTITMGRPVDPNYDVPNCKN